MAKFILIFLTMLYGFFGVYNISTSVQTASSQKNAQYTDYLTSATHDAVKEMKKTTDGTVMMPKSIDREKILLTFMNSLSLDFGYDTNEDMTQLRTYVPVVAMVDNNGYYIAHNVLYKEGGANYLKSAITELNTWSRTSGNYMVRYYLGDNVDVTDMTKSVPVSYSGKYNEVLARITKNTGNTANVDLGQKLGFSDEKSFNKKKTQYIVSQMQDKIEYYINQQNAVATTFTPGYVFQMPTTSEDDWARTLEHPTCIAFLQGVRVSDTQKYLNIYSIGGGEVQKTDGIVYKETGNQKVLYTGNKTPLAENEISGYTANDRQSSSDSYVVNYMDTPEQEDSLAEKILHVTHYHKPSASPILNGGVLLGYSEAGGCFTIPVYHEHTSSCYTTAPHHHDATCIRYGVHYHTDACYSNVYHTHEAVAGAIIDTNGRSNKKGKCYSEAVVVNGVTLYEPNCGFWEVDKLTPEATEIKKMADGAKVGATTAEKTEARTIAINRLAVGGRTPASISDADIKEYINAMLRYYKSMTVVDQRLTCGKNNGDTDNSNITYTCGKAEGQMVSTLTCTRSGQVEYFKAGCGHEEGEEILKSQDDYLKTH